MVDQRTIAEKLGIAQTTVSRALRGSSLVHPKTRQRILKAAKQLGYQANPLFSALVEHVRSGKKIRNHGSIAVVFDMESASRRNPLKEAAELQFRGISERAAFHGFQVECFYLRGKGNSAKNIDRILFNRGVTALILPGSELLPEFGLHFHWKRYAAVAIGGDWDSLQIDRVSTDHRHNVRLAIQKLSELDYRRIGLLLPKADSLPRDQAVWSSYLAHFYALPKNRQIPAFTGRFDGTDLGELRSWIKRWKPDSLIASVHREAEWSLRLGASLDCNLPLVSLNQPSESCVPGVDENNLNLGELACDLVIKRIIHNEYGLPPKPQLVLVDGTWVHGTKPIPVRSNPEFGRPK